MLNLVLALAAAYVIICLLARGFHRNFVYQPDGTRVPPQDAGLPSVEEVELTAKDGTKLIAWHMPARGAKPTMLYFTGNSGNAAQRAGKIAMIAADGYGVFMLNYRRFGGSRGWPTEKNNLADACVAYDYLCSRGLAAKDIVAYGESLGTGVAVQLALSRAVKALVLESPFTSLPELAKKAWPFFPLNLVIADRYQTIDKISGVDVPLLIVHGARDDVIPIAHGRRVYHVANQPKQLSILPRAGHNDLFEQGAWDKVYEFVEALEPKRKPELELVESDADERVYVNGSALYAEERPRARRRLSVG